MTAAAAGSVRPVLHADGLFRADRWHLLRDADGDGAALAQTGAPTIVPLAHWLELQHAEAAARAPHAAALALWLAPADDPRVLAPHLDRLPLVAIDFPKMADGRGFSLAVTLRRHLGYRGELRAVGEVLVDQLFMLRRVGFSSFTLRADQTVDDALRALARYSAVYQSSVDGAVPAWRRRSRAGACA